jgi:Mlc titration factor MtfA (ptsG expression regulator)
MAHRGLVATLRPSDDGGTLSTLSPDELREALDAAFPLAWREILRRRVPFYRTLSEPEQERFEDKVQHFVLTKIFSSTGRLAITDEMKVVVAAAACRLTLNLPWEEYTHVSHVTLRDKSWDHDGTSVIGVGGRWKVTLSWPSLLTGMAEPDDGNNVGYHEFAHALDGADGSMDGEARGPPGPHDAVWTHVIASARADVANALRAGVAPPIDEYAATSDVELFAVATEWFFERPHDLRAAMPAVYDLLRAFYRQDPGAR